MCCVALCGCCLFVVVVVFGGGAVLGAEPADRSAYRRGAAAAARVRRRVAPAAAHAAGDAKPHDSISGPLRLPHEHPFLSLASLSRSSLVSRRSLSLSLASWRRVHGAWVSSAERCGHGPRVVYFCVDEGGAGGQGGKGRLPGLSACSQLSATIPAVCSRSLLFADVDCIRVHGRGVQSGGCGGRGRGRRRRRCRCGRRQSVQVTSRA